MAGRYKLEEVKCFANKNTNWDHFDPEEHIRVNFDENKFIKA
jgi:hypothetical protein